MACVRPQLSAGGGTWTRSKSPDFEMDFYNTPRKINIEPENDGLEDEFPFPGVYSQVPAVNLLGCIEKSAFEFRRLTRCQSDSNFVAPTEDRREDWITLRSPQQHVTRCMDLHYAPTWCKKCHMKMTCQEQWTKVWHVCDMLFKLTRTTNSIWTKWILILNHYMISADHKSWGLMAHKSHQSRVWFRYV